MRRRGWLLLAVLLVGAIAGVLLARGRLEAGGSSLSRGATGWLAARSYLARRGTAVETLDRPLASAAAGGGGTLVIAFPWQSRAFDLELEALQRHLDAGGDILLAYSPEAVPSPGELAMLDALGVSTARVRGVPLSPWRWLSAVRQPWLLRPAARWSTAAKAAAGAPSLLLRRPRWLPELPAAGALLRGPGQRVVAAAWKQRRGRVVVLPAELLCNARLAAPAHAALLETLGGWLRGPWRFDEYHHGLVPSGEEVVSSATRRGFDLLLLQLLLIYAVAALALARRLGPAWRETPPLAGNAGSFLLRLGSLHHRLQHHGEGASLVLRRAAELDRRLHVDAGLRALAQRGEADAETLVAVAQAVARLQR